MRRPPALEWQAPPEPVPYWAARGIPALALAVLVHTALAWWWAWDESAPAVELRWVLDISCALLAAALPIWGFARQGAPAWGLRFDGEQWHWWHAEGRGPVNKADGDVQVRRGSGQISLALACGPWCLLRAQAAAGQGRSAWIWLRPTALRSPHDTAGTASLQVQHLNAARLRTLLNWS